MKGLTYWEHVQKKKGQVLVKSIIILIIILNMYVFIKIVNDILVGDAHCHATKETNRFK